MSFNDESLIYPNDHDSAVCYVGILKRYSNAMNIILVYIDAKFTKVFDVREIDISNKVAITDMTSEGVKMQYFTRLV